MRDIHMYDHGGGEFIAGVYKERLYASRHPEYARFHYTHVAAAGSCNLKTVRKLLVIC